MPHLVDIHAGKQLRIRRTMLGLSQENIGKAVGISFQQIQKYERGVDRMSASRLHDFASHLRVPVSYFFEGLEKTPSSTSGGEGVAEEPENLEYEKIKGRETLDLVRAYYRIGDSGLRTLIRDLIVTLSKDDPV